MVTEADASQREGITLAGRTAGSLVPIAVESVQRPADERGADVAGGRRRRWRWLIAALVLVVVAGGGWVAGQQVQSPDQAASSAAPPEPSWITATVERRVLARTVISRGDVRPEVSIDVGVPSSVEGEPVVTNVGVATGDEVVEGARLVELSGRPVFVMQGDVPVYRSLRPGMSGADVAQLQEALVRLGYEPDSDGVFGQVTKNAVTAFYNAAGYEPVPTSESVAADVAAAEQALTDAESALTDAEEALGDLTAPDGGSVAVTAAQVELQAARRAVNDATAAATSAVTLAQQQLDVAAAENHRVQNDPEAGPAEREQAALAVAQATAAVDQARRDGDAQIASARDRVTVAEAALAEATAAPDVDAATRTRDNAVAVRDRALGALWTLIATSGPTVAQGEIVFVPTLPARIRTSATLGPAGGGADAVTPSTSTGGSLVSLAGGSLVVSMTARPGEVELLRVGMGVELLDEQANVTYPATVTDVAETSATGANGEIGHRVLLTPDEPLPAVLAGVNVRVTITAASTGTETLVVPVAAVSSASSGGTRVSVLREGAVDPVDVAVTAGLSADGFVAVEPVEAATLDVGDRVVVGR